VRENQFYALISSPYVLTSLPGVNWRGKRMEYVNLGRSRLKVSRLCLGCMSYGVPSGAPHPWTLREEDSRPFLARVLELDITFFDTSNSYSDGTSDEISAGPLEPPRPLAACPAVGGGGRVRSGPPRTSPVRGSTRGRRRPTERSWTTSLRSRPRGVPRAQVALAWLLGRPGVTAPVVGATRAEHLEDAEMRSRLPVARTLATAHQKPRDRAVKAAISFLVEEYDPEARANAVMKCVVRNDSLFPVHVPVGFDALYVQVESGKLTLFPAKRTWDDVRLAWVEPGHEEVVFELPLDEVLSGKYGNDASYRWNWQRQPEPPLSPIHQYRKPGYVESADFVVSIDLGNSSIASPPATLKVKMGERR
jgi:hypothetical protein